jgi:hypothetical protein
MSATGDTHTQTKRGMQTCRQIDRRTRAHARTVGHEVSHISSRVRLRRVKCAHLGKRWDDVTLDGKRLVVGDVQVKHLVVVEAVGGWVTVGGWVVVVVVVDGWVSGWVREWVRG